MDADSPTEEGYYAVVGNALAPAWKCRAARCAWANVGDRARLDRDVHLHPQLPEWLGTNTAFLSPPSCAAACALLGKIPTVAEYMENTGSRNAKADIYQL